MTSDQIQTISGVSRALTRLNQAKLDLEYAVQLAVAKGLSPDQNGDLPQAVTVTDGLIDGTDIAPAEYALAMAGIAAIVSTLESQIAQGITLEAALLRASR